MVIQSGKGAEGLVWRGGNSPELCPQSSVCVPKAPLGTLPSPSPPPEQTQLSLQHWGPTVPTVTFPREPGTGQARPTLLLLQPVVLLGEGRKEGDSSLTSPIPAGAELFPVQDWFFQPEGKPRALLVQCRAVLTPSGKCWRWNILLLLLCCPKGWERNWEKPGVLPSGREMS